MFAHLTQFLASVERPLPPTMWTVYSCGSMKPSCCASAADSGLWASQQGSMPCVEAVEDERRGDGAGEALAAVLGRGVDLDFELVVGHRERRASGDAGVAVPDAVADAVLEEGVGRAPVRDEVLRDGDVRRDVVGADAADAVAVGQRRRLRAEAFAVPGVGRGRREAGAGALRHLLAETIAHEVGPVPARRDDGAALDHAQRLRCSGRVRVAGDEPEVAVRDGDARALEVVDPGAAEVRRADCLDEAVEAVLEAWNIGRRRSCWSGGSSCIGGSVVGSSES